MVTLSLGPVGGVLLSAIITYVMPKKFESEAVAQVASPTESQTGESDLEPRMMATTSKVFTSHEVLARVVESLELTNRWNLDPNTCMQILKRILRVESVPGTDLTSIRCRHTNKIDARDIANEVSAAYKDYRGDMEQKRMNAALDELRKAVRDQEDKVGESHKILSTLLQSKGTPAANPNASTMSADQLDVIDAKRIYEMEAALLEQMKLKQVSETIRAKIPGEQVRIHSPALIAGFPISPNVTSNLIFGTAAGLLAGIILAFLIAPFLGSSDRRPPPH